MLRSKTTVAYDITDTVNLQYRHEGYEIFKVRANVTYIGCEKAEDKSFLVFGEYTLFLLLKSLDKKSDYSIKAIRCPFIKTVSISDRLLAFSDSSKLQVSLGDPPECNLEDMDIKPVNKNALCRINLSYRVEFWESGRVRTPISQIDLQIRKVQIQNHPTAVLLRYGEWTVRKNIP